MAHVKKGMSFETRAPLSTHAVVVDVDRETIITKVTSPGLKPGVVCIPVRSEY